MAIWKHWQGGLKGGGYQSFWQNLLRYIAPPTQTLSTSLVVYGRLSNRLETPLRPPCPLSTYFSAPARLQIAHQLKDLMLILPQSLPRIGGKDLWYHVWSGLLNHCIEELERDRLFSILSEAFVSRQPLFAHGSYDIYNKEWRHHSITTLEAPAIFRKNINKKIKGND